MFLNKKIITVLNNSSNLIKQTLMIVDAVLKDLLRQS